MVLPSTAKIEETGSDFAPVSLLGWARFALRLSALLLTLLLLIPLHFLTHAIGRPSHWPRRFLGSAAWIVGADVRLSGKHCTANAFFIANHLSWIDILVMGGATGAAFVGKAELGKTPVIGWLCSLNRTLYVSREDRLGVARQIGMVRDAMAENHAIAVFPEGTTSDGQTLLPFKTSLLAVLEPPPPGIVVQPIYLDYGNDAPVVAWVGDESGKGNAIRMLSRAGRFGVTVHFLEAFEPTHLDGRKAIAAEARKRIDTAMLVSR